MKNVCIIATGGTIDKIHDPIAEALVFSGGSHIPEILEEARIHNVNHVVVMLKDSLQMTEEDRALILKAVQARPEKAIVITHGTSTMTVTAAYLKGKVGDRTVVFTGAMRPFSFFKSDAGFNLGSAIGAAQAASPGIYIAMNGRIWPEGTVRKNEAKGMFEPVGS